jgi:hypothetical protein
MIMKPQLSSFADDSIPVANCSLVRLLYPNVAAKIIRFRLQTAFPQKVREIQQEREKESQYFSNITGVPEYQDNNKDCRWSAVDVVVGKLGRVGRYTTPSAIFI